MSEIAVCGMNGAGKSAAARALLELDGERPAAENVGIILNYITEHKLSL